MRTLPGRPAAGSRLDSRARALLMFKARVERHEQRSEGRVEMSESLSIEVQHDPAGKQFAVTVDGHRAYLSYMDLGKQTIDIYRTYVPDSLRGRGVAAALTEEALRFAEAMGYTVIPSCSYVERYMERRQGSVAREA